MLNPGVGSMQRQLHASLQREFGFNTTSVPNLICEMMDDYNKQVHNNHLGPGGDLLDGMAVLFQHPNPMEEPKRGQLLKTLARACSFPIR